MYKELEFSIKGVAPTLIHSGRLANPLDPIVKQMKLIHSKRKKTDDDIAALAKLEWLGSFYPETDGGFEVKGNEITVVGYGRPHWPSDNIERMLQDAAAKNRLGKQFKAGVMVPEDGFLIYEGPDTIEELFHDRRFWDTRSAKIQRATVQRTRPIFRNWSMKFTVHYLPDIVDPSAVTEAVMIAGRLIGLSDNRPKYGRFEVLN